MFTFDFSRDNEGEDTNTKDTTKVIYLESNEVLPNENIFPIKIDLTKDCSYLKCKNDLTITYISNNFITKCIKEMHEQSSIAFAEKNHSDLIPGVYEGGLKIWECTKDLVDFICDMQINLDQKEVLDLGCGVGIVGILSLLKGAHVYFQDYNPEVITSVTMPNVFLNLRSVGALLTMSKFYSGDWQSFLKIIENINIKFDYIFTSETIYNVDNYNKLHSILTNCLKENGVIYVAAKTCYFGVGGGLRSFEDFIMKKGILDCQTEWMCSDGISREILKLTLKQKKL